MAKMARASRQVTPPSWAANNSRNAGKYSRGTDTGRPGVRRQAASEPSVTPAPHTGLGLVQSGPLTTV